MIHHKLPQTVLLPSYALIEFYSVEYATHVLNTATALKIDGALVRLSYARHQTLPAPSVAVPATMGMGRAMGMGGSNEAPAPLPPHLAGHMAGVGLGGPSGGGPPRPGAGPGAGAGGAAGGGGRLMAQKKPREWPPSFEEVINGPLNETKSNGHLNGHLTETASGRTSRALGG